MQRINRNNAIFAQSQQSLSLPMPQIERSNRVFFCWFFVRMKFVCLYPLLQTLCLDFHFVIDLCQQFGMTSIPIQRLIKLLFCSAVFFKNRIIILLLLYALCTCIDHLHCRLSNMNIKQYSHHIVLRQNAPWTHTAPRQ